MLRVNMVVQLCGGGGGGGGCGGGHEGDEADADDRAKRKSADKHTVVGLSEQTINFLAKGALPVSG